MFTPVLDLEVLTRATVLRFTDITGPDVVGATGWDGVAGVDSTNVSAANLVITDPNSDVTTESVVVEILAADPVLGDIVFDDITGEWVDGFYDVVYNVWMAGTAITVFADYSGTVAGTVLVTSATHLVQTGMSVTITGTTNYNGTFEATYVNVNTYYITATWVADDAAGTSTPLYTNTFTPFIFANAEMAIDKMYAAFSIMIEGIEADNYLKNIEQATGLLNSLRSALATSTVATINNIYGRIIRILDYYSIDLIYS